ncbi:MAG: glycosyltransferase family 2 protein [Verrucomicrobiota bacterium]
MEHEVSKDRSLSVLIPVHNEAEALRPFLDELYAKCLGQLTNFELLMLEDGSEDNTAAVLRECEKQYRNLIAVTEPERVGYRITVTRGIAKASKEWILLMDGDGQIEPADIWLLLDSPPYYDIVAGEKFPRCDPAYRIIVSRVFDIITDMFLGLSIRDINFGFKLMRASIAKQLAPQCGQLGEIYSAELVIRFVYGGYRLHQERVRHRKRSIGPSQGIPLRKLLPKSWRAFTGMLRLRKELTSAPTAQTPPA